MGPQALCWGLAAPAPASEKASAYSLPGPWVTLQDAETHEDSGSSTRAHPPPAITKINSEQGLSFRL